MAAHRAQLIRQTEPAPEHSDFGTEPRFKWTGLALLACHCGYASGWVPPDTIKDDIYEHLVRPGMETKPLKD